MKLVGAHVSAAGGVDRTPGNAVSIGGRAFAMFTRNQKRWYAPPLTGEEVSAFKRNLAASGILPSAVLPHAGYLINPGNPDPEKRKKSIQALTDEVLRAGELGLLYINVHPGTHLGLSSEAECLATVAGSIRSVLDGTEGVTVVMETTAGSGHTVGHRFEHLAEIISRVGRDDRMGVCIDTSHIFAAGYDVRSPEGFCSVMEEFEAVVGFSFLKGVHLNDSKPPLGSRADRHACLGEGEIGLDAFRMIMNDRRFDGVPLILETPNPEGWAGEISMLYRFDESCRVSTAARP